MSDSQRPHGLQPTRLLHPWDFPSKSIGVGCHCLLLGPHLAFLNCTLDSCSLYVLASSTFWVPEIITYLRISRSSDTINSNHLIFPGPYFNSSSFLVPFQCTSNSSTASMLTYCTVFRFLPSLFGCKLVSYFTKTVLLLPLLSHFSRVRLCDPTDGSPPGSSVPGILQARTLEWDAISFSNAWKWKVKVKSKPSNALFLKWKKMCIFIHLVSYYLKQRS